MPSHVIKYVLGLFCYENFSFIEATRQKIAQKFNFSFDDIIKMNIKEDIVFYLRNAEPLHIPFADFDEFMRPACAACDDFSNVYADISFGGIGSNEQFTSTLVRTKKGSEIYNGALSKGYIVEFEEYNTSVMKSKMIAKVISSANWKEKRAEQFHKKKE